MGLIVLLLAVLALPCVSRAETDRNSTTLTLDIQSDSDDSERGRARGDTPDFEEEPESGPESQPEPAPEQEPEPEQEPQPEQEPEPEPEPQPEPEPTVAESDYESNYNYLLSRLAAVDQAIHKLNVGHYTLDVKVSQLLDRLLRLEGKLADVEDSVHEVSNFCKEDRREIGRLEGCVKGRRVGPKCFLVYRVYDTYAGASQKCQERGGRMAMPRDRREQEALAEYVKLALPGSNWPVWLGVNDLRSEGLYLFDDGTRVTYFQWRKHFLSSQPDGGKRENCVAMSSDDGDWWDNYCDRRMFYLCEFEA